MAVCLSPSLSPLLAAGLALPPLSFGHEGLPQNMSAESAEIIDRHDFGFSNKIKQTYKVLVI